MDYVEADKNALSKALLALGVCPYCRRDLRPVGCVERVFGCDWKQYPKHPAETWFLESEKHGGDPMPVAAAPEVQ